MAKSLAAVEPVKADPAVRLAAGESLIAGRSDHSVLVSRGNERVAMAPTGFDPFEADELASAAPMPEVEEAAQPHAAEAGRDPFDSDAAANEPAHEMAIELAPTDVAAMQDAFDEPQADEEAAKESAELDAARDAIDQELMRRAVEAGADGELVKPEAGAEEEAVQPEEPADDAAQMDQMADEIVQPELDAEPMDEESLEDFGASEDDSAEMQVGPDGQPFQLTPEQEAERQRLLEQERIEHEAKCNELLDAVRRDSIKNISLDIRVPGSPGEDFPLECTARPHTFEPRAWAEITYLWKASGLCHKPLYFEQVQLERYGHDAGPVLAPIISGAHFFGTLPILPYKMGLQTPNECVYTLGYYRPGNCAPYMVQPLGFTWRAAAFQAGAVTGTAFAVP